MKALVLASGGVDSTTALAMAVEKYGKENVFALSISYGQKHDRETEAAKRVAGYYGVEQRFLDLSLIFKDSGSSLLKNSNEKIPEGSYADLKSACSENNKKSDDNTDSEDLDFCKTISEKNAEPVFPKEEKTNAAGNGLISTYVPFRNGLFLASAASIAQSLGCSVILYGAHADDATGSAYPDCTPEFNDAMNRSIIEGTGHEVRIEAPFVNMTKAEVVKIGLGLKVPYEYTWSCYEGGEKPCGVCATCIDRAKAFAENGVNDPALE